MGNRRTAITGEGDEIEAHKGLVVTICGRHAARQLVPYDELEAAGLVGLLFAVRTWTTDGGATFGAWATACIRQEIAQYLDERNGRSDTPAGRARRAATHAPWTTDDDRRDLADTVPDRDVDVESVACSRWTIDRAAALMADPRHRIALGMLAAGENRAEAARRIGVSPNTVGNWVRAWAGTA